MGSGNQYNICDSVIPFTLEAIPYYDGGSDAVRRPKTKPKALTLFPLTPNFKTFKKESSRRKSTRHGPRPKSSPFRGVTHYKRTGRWEAHIWQSQAQSEYKGSIGAERAQSIQNKGRQVYLGASSTAEAAARAYDRAALHFRQMDAELNFSFEGYAGEYLQLVELSDKELETMLRKQSAGDGTLYPEYPPRIELQLFTPTLFGVPIYLTARI